MDPASPRLRRYVRDDSFLAIHFSRSTQLRPVTPEIPKGLPGPTCRGDIHSVFDAGYMTIDEDLKFVVSDRVRTDFNNGNEYRRLHGSLVTVPTLPKHQPDRAGLRWHNETVFLG